MTWVSRGRASPELSGEQKVQIVLAVLAGELTVSAAARRHGVAPSTVQVWRNRFLEAGRLGVLEERPPGTKPKESVVERRMRLENEQLKLALAEATVQLRIWKKGAEHIPEVPSPTSRP
jgi:transposase